MGGARTIKEWREARGLTVQELADKIGVNSSRLERWEEVGVDWDQATREGGELDNRFLEGILFAVLRPDPEGILVSSAPEHPAPGELVINPNPSVFPISSPQALLDLAEELDIKMAVPTKWGIVLKHLSQMTEADYKAIDSWREAEARYQAKQAEKFRKYADFLKAQAASGDEDITLGEALERHERGTQDLRERLGEEDAPVDAPIEFPVGAEEPFTTEVPAHYPVFDSPDNWRRWDNTKEAWAWKAEREFYEDSEITAAARFYTRVGDWHLVPGLLSAAGWEHSEEGAEEFVRENQAKIEARTQQINP